MSWARSSIINETEGELGKLASSIHCHIRRTVPHVMVAVRAVCLTSLKSFASFKRTVSILHRLFDMVLRGHVRSGW